MPERQPSVVHIYMCRRCYFFEEIAEMEEELHAWQEQLASSYADDDVMPAPVSRYRPRR